MFVTRATRHDKDDIVALLATEADRFNSDDAEANRGTAYIARDGAVVGCIRLIEVEPNRVVVDDVLVLEDRRGAGIGRRLLEAAMNAKGGTLYLCCHDDVLDFYAKFGFNEVPFEDMPDPVKDYFKRVGDDVSTEEHRHFFLTAR